MTEWSGLWTAGAGDGHPYSQDEISDHVWKVIVGDPDANAGVFPGQLDELAISSPGNNSVRVASGRALVDGMFYESDADNDLTVASATTGTTGCRVVLRKTWAARTVRAAVIRSADGTAALPALTQVDGATWEIPLAAFTITTGGVIGSLTDEREYLSIGGASSLYGNGADGNVTITGHVDLVRDMYYDTLTVNAGATLDTDGFRVFATTAVVNNGTITNLAGEATTPGQAPVAARAAPAGSLGGGGDGTYRGASSGGGGGGGVVLVAAPSITGTGTIHANGSNGGATSATGQINSAGLVVPPAASVGSVSLLDEVAYARAGRNLNSVPYNGGAGGGVYESSTSLVAAPTVTNALGGAGGAVSGANQSGGGGGGAVITISRQPPTLTRQANSGTGVGGGQAGTAGRVVTLLVK